jgi:crossover junction endodeoxyribonuclease RusA
MVGGIMTRFKGETDAIEYIPTSWVLEFPDYPPSPNARMHFMPRAVLTKDWREAAAMRCKMARIPHLKRIRVSAVVVRRSLGVADEDNDRARLKPIIDGIVDAGVIPNDRRGCIVWGDVGEKRGPKGLLVIIEAI